MLGQNADEFQHMPIRISKIYLSRWHPPDRARLIRFVNVGFPSARLPGGKKEDLVRMPLQARMNAQGRCRC
jgi:hypothetical protein